VIDRISRISRRTNISAIMVMSTWFLVSFSLLRLKYNLPKRQLIGLPQKIVDMIQVWKVLGSVISVEEEQVVKV
jgi:hypothetical protein